MRPMPPPPILKHILVAAGDETYAATTEPEIISSLLSAMWLMPPPPRLNSYSLCRCFTVVTHDATTAVGFKILYVAVLCCDPRRDNGRGFQILLAVMHHRHQFHAKIRRSCTRVRLDVGAVCWLFAGPALASAWTSVLCVGSPVLHSRAPGRRCCVLAVRRSCTRVRLHVGAVCWLFAANLIPFRPKVGLTAGTRTYTLPSW